MNFCTRAGMEVNVDIAVCFLFPVYGICPAVEAISWLREVTRVSELRMDF